MLSLTESCEASSGQGNAPTLGGYMPVPFVGIVYKAKRPYLHTLCIKILLEQ